MRTKSMRRRNSGSNGNCRIEIPALVFLDCEGGQRAGSIRPGVDADAVRALVDTIADGMPVNDDEAVIAIVEQERFADPPQVRLALLVERHARANPGMNEEVVAEPAGIDEGPQ